MVYPVADFIAHGANHRLVGVSDLDLRLPIDLLQEFPVCLKTMPGYFDFADEDLPFLSSPLFGFQGVGGEDVAVNAMFVSEKIDIVGFHYVKIPRFVQGNGHLIALDAEVLGNRACKA